MKDFYLIRKLYEKLFFLILLILSLLTGYQNEVRSKAEFQLENISLNAFENNTNYVIVTPFEWEGDNGTALKAIHIVNSQGEKLSTEKEINAVFYIGDSSKKTGVYKRDM